jgi:hypothetical protein
VATIYPEDYRVTADSGLFVALIRRQPISDRAIPGNMVDTSDFDRPCPFLRRRAGEAAEKAPRRDYLNKDSLT